MNQIKQFFVITSMFAMVFCSCSNNNHEPESQLRINDTVVFADAETEPVISRYGEDAADDPAIWIHPTDPLKSTVIGTNKKAGLSVYNLDGEELYFYPIGNVNNVDVRYNFRFNDGSTMDILVTSNRSSNTVVIMGIDNNSGELTEIATREFSSNVDEVYGCCLYYDPQVETHYAFVNGKDGGIEQWELFDNGIHAVDAKIVRELSVSSQPEGMVADDELGYLYVGEEMRGIWKFDANANGPADATMLALSDTSNEHISYDIEGLTLYYGTSQNGYLIASSQGNYSFAIFERTGNNKYITSFSVKDNMVDGAEETDGLDVTNVSLGDKYPNGLVVVQDGYNYEGDSLVNQNFKYIGWEKITNLTTPNLILDTGFDLRAFSEVDN
jgi:3-phytase